MQSENPSTEAPGIGRLASCALVALAAGAMALARPGATPLEGHEAFVILAAETMAAPGRWLDPASQSSAVASPDQVGPSAPANTTLNHWTVPLFNGRPRFEKTPLAYWAAAVPLKLGLAPSEFAARLPSAVSGILLGLVTLALGRRLFTPRAALLGALALVASLGFYQWSRSARPDMMLTLFMTAAMLCFYRGIDEPRAGRRAAWLLAGWLALGLANCAKEFAPLFLGLPIVAFLAWRASLCGGGPMCPPSSDRQKEGPHAGGPLHEVRQLLVYFALSVAGLLVYEAVRALVPMSSRVVIALTMAACLGLPPAWYLVATRGWRQLGALLPTALPGAALMLLCFVPWLWYMAHLFPGASGIFESQVVERTATAGAEFGVKQPAYYLPRLLALGLPWSLLAALALATPFMKRFKPERTQLVFLILWIFGIVLLFSAATGKRQHYVLPALPAVALLAGFLLDDLFFAHRWLSSRAAVMVVSLTAAAALIGVALRVSWLSTHAAGMRAAFVFAVQAIVPLALLGLAVVWTLKRRAAPALGAFVAAVLAAFVAHSAWPSASETQSVYRDAAVEAKALAGKDEMAASWGEPDAAVVFYYGSDIPVEFGEQPPFNVLISVPAHAEELSKAGFVPAHPERLAGAAHDEPLVFVRRK